MPLHSQRVIDILLAECKARPERFPGYNDDLLETLAEIMKLENEHRRRGTNIKQRVADACNALGQVISRKKSD